MEFIYHDKTTNDKEKNTDNNKRPLSRKKYIDDMVKSLGIKKKDKVNKE